MSRHIALALIATGLTLVVVPFALARGVGARAFSKQLPGLGALSLDFVRVDTLYMDRGSKETLLGAEAFDRALETYGIPFRHHVFEGGHADDFQERHLRMLRFLAMRWTPGA